VAQSCRRNNRKQQQPPAGVGLYADNFRSDPAVNENVIFSDI